jgi:hypothetical protein
VILFEPIVEKRKLHGNFSKIYDSASHVASRRSLQDAYDRLPKPDNNFVKDFQTAGFDSRVWELYLAELFRSRGLKLEQPQEQPDFLLTDSEGEQVWIEATTANESYKDDLSISKDGHWQEQDEIAIKLGSSLWSKLNKRYWDRPHVSGKPLIFAISNFAEKGIRHSSHALGRYLYGMHAQLQSNPGEEVRYTEIPLEVHEARKTIPSGFFALPDAENISGVLFSNAGTVAKFNRMGWQINPVPNILMLRTGWAYDFDPTAMLPAPFVYLIGEREEDWGEEAILFHNPHAKFPVKSGYIAGIAEEFLVNSEVKTFVPDFHPMGSLTTTMLGNATDMGPAYEKLIKLGDAWMASYYELKSNVEQQSKEAYERWQPLLSKK